jgi:hypothetical protein
MVNKSQAQLVLESLPVAANRIPGLQPGDTTWQQSGIPYVGTHEGGGKAADSKSGQDNAQQEDGSSGYAGGSGQRLEG